VAAVSGRIVDWEGRRLDFGRGVMTFDGHAFQLDFGRRLGRARLPEDEAELFFPCGGNMLVRKASFEAAGGFDEDYFAYLEDVDLGWRLWSGGERVLYADAAEVRAHRSAATSDLLGHFHRGFLFERNAFLTAYKNYEAGLWERVMPAVLLAYTHRTQTLLVENNPGAAVFTLDPYAGLIANTAPPGEVGADPSPASPPAPREPRTLAEKWRVYGPIDFTRRGFAKAWRLLRSRRPEPPRVTDERTVAQLRATTWLLAHLDAAASSRAAVQRRRKRSDAEIFRRFPAYLVPTYPGDDRLFASEGFRAWLPDDLPLERAALEEVIAWPPGEGE
jgi:hypothetical protein